MAGGERGVQIKNSVSMCYEEKAEKHNYISHSLPVYLSSIF